MATWFAQNSSVNIDSVNQWNSAANGSGSWLTWASLAVGDILVLNGKTNITINVNVTCSEINGSTTYGGTTGGTLLMNSGITVTANLTGAASVVITCNAGDQTINGNLTAGGGAGGVVVKSTSGTLTLTGNITAGGSNLTHGLRLSGTSVAIVTGTITGGTIIGGGSAHGIWHSSSGTLSVTGNVTGQTGAVGYGIASDGSGQITVTGNVTGGTSNSGFGIQCAGTSVLQVTGNVTGNGVEAINVTASGSITITGTVTAGSSAPAVYSTLASLVLTVNGDIVSASNGRAAIGRALLLISSSATITHTYRVNNAGSAGSARSLYTGGTNLGQPTAANVRSGTVFGASSEYTGTLAVPSPTLVAIGVATDNTVGSYNPSVNASDIRNAIGLASANLDTQLSGISNKTTNLPSDPADQSLLEAAITSGVNSISTLIDSLPTNAELATALAAADDAVLAAIAALNNLSAAQVNTELLDVLSVDTFGELSAPPAATSSLKDKLTWLFMWAKNKATETSTQRKLYADNSTTVVSTETVSDDGTTFTKTKAS